MIYRDRPSRCPRCSVDITRDEARERWRCDRCNGLMMSISEVAEKLIEVAPDLLPSGAGVNGLTTLGRRTYGPPLQCGVCSAPMEPVFLGGVDIDRCFHDELLWFDHDKLTRVLDIAREQHLERKLHRGWLSRLLD